MPKIAGLTPNPEGMNTNTRYSKSNQPDHTPNFPHIGCLFSYQSSLILIYNSNITVDNKVKSFFLVSQCHDFALTPSAVYNKWSIHPRWTVLQPDCFHSHNCMLTPESRLSTCRTPCQFDHQHPSLPERLNIKFCHYIPKVAN